MPALSVTSSSCGMVRPLHLTAFALGGGGEPIETPCAAVRAGATVVASRMAAANPNFVAVALTSISPRLVRLAIFATPRPQAIPSESPSRAARRKSSRPCAVWKCEEIVAQKRASPAWLLCFELEIREYGTLDHILVVRANANPHIKWRAERHSRRAVLFPSAGIRIDPHRKLIAALGNAHAFWRPKMRNNLMRHIPLFQPVLQRGQSVPMARHIHVGRIRVQALADHEHRFAMGVSARVQKRDVRRQGHVAADLPPRKLERVLPQPHVLAAARQRVRSRGAVKGGRPGM